MELESIDPQLKELFTTAGVSDNELKNPEMRDFIYDFIDNHGGVQAFLKESALLNVQRSNTQDSKPQSNLEPPPPVPPRTTSTVLAHSANNVSQLSCPIFFFFCSICVIIILALNHCLNFTIKSKTRMLGRFDQFQGQTRTAPPLPPSRTNPPTAPSVPQVHRTVPTRPPPPTNSPAPSLPPPPPPPPPTSKEGPTISIPPPPPLPNLADVESEIIRTNDNGLNNARNNNSQIEDPRSTLMESIRSGTTLKVSINTRLTRNFRELDN